MITFPLTLRYGPRPLRETQAWYIAGSDIRLWLDEIVSWDVAHAKIRLLPMPHSAHDRQPCGLLAVVDGGFPTTFRSGRCLPYGQITNRLYLPVESWLAPDVSEAELSDRLSSNSTYVWHPTSGLVAFEPTDILGVADLLKMGRSRDLRWDRAQAGVTLSRKLVSLLPVEFPTFETALEAGRDGIGSDTDSMSELPPSPNEPGSGIVETPLRHGKRFAAEIVQWFGKYMPATSGTPTWVDRIERWAENQLSNYNAELDAARNKELERLMHMLETDPDQGLRFALSVGGDAHRGIAPPSGQLVEGSTDFSLDRLSGGHAADFWDMSSSYQTKLLTRYRELANRELQLGRHRRAAYIFAELLGDYSSAASALVDGRHWREAAVLY